MGSEGSSTSANGGATACAVCGGTAAVYCPADAAALCAHCDAAIHAANPLASRHDRVPLAAAMVATSGVYDLFAADDEGASSWPAGQGHGSPNSSSSSFSNCSGAETSLFHLLSDVNLMSAGAAGGSLSDGVSVHGAAAAPLWLHPGLATDASAWSSPSESAAVAAAAAAADRRERVRRYREKRKNRKFQKTIRYASRKAYAEARPRIKGRFVKRAACSDDDSTSADADGAKFWLSFSDDSLVFDPAAYGVVPTF